MTLIPSSRRGALGRFGLGAVIVILFTATTTAVAGLLQFKQFAADLSGTPALKSNEVTIANPGNPQTILVVGSDHRAGEPYSAANTDTMMLVRMDPNSSTINVISIPRDLEVQLPQGGGTGPAKLNEAYSLGGTDLLVKTLKQQVFPGLHVNHIVDVNFGGFDALVNAIGCVYTDVDHRYYNNTALTNYSSIDLQPGFQKLCGSDALSFVRFRHSDNDIVRNARQQDFIRWAKDQYGTSQLIANRDTLLSIFGQHAQTDKDLHTVDGLINLFNLVAFSAGHSIKQIPFPAILQPCGPPPPGASSALQQTPCYVTADPGAEQAAFRSLMTPSTQSGGAPPAPSKGASAGHGGGSPSSPQPSNLVADPTDGKGQAGALRNVGLAVYYPRMIATGSQYCSGTVGNCPAEVPTTDAYPRAYLIHDKRGAPHSSYRMTIVLNSVLGQYYGVQGTTWLNPPILASPTQTRTVDGKQLLLYFNGQKLSLVAWRTPQAAYWISNTLTDDLSSQQMIAIAASLTPA